MSTVGRITNCKDLLKLLGDYVDGDVDPVVCEDFEQHLEGCDPCQVVIDNIRQTLTLYRNDEPYELPVAFRDRLRDTLRRKWSRRT